MAGCQVAVTLQFATAAHVVALDARLYLPEAWAGDRDRLTKAGVPAAVGYQPKWQMALAVVRRAVANGFDGVVSADSLFGTVTAFREQLAADGRTDCVGIDSTPKVVAADAGLGPVPSYAGTGQPPARPATVRRGATSPSVKDWALARAGDFRTVRWREGSKGRMAGRFAAWRVRPAHQLSAGTVPLAACGLLGEWPERAAAPTRYFVSNLPARTSLKRLVDTTKGRWPVEKSQADCTSSGRWVGTRRTGYHRRDGGARAGRVGPATPGRSRRRNRMPAATRRPTPPRA